MALTKLQFRPGINREITSYSNEGGWVDSDKVRFRFGYPEKIGGWEKYTTQTYLGTPRSLHAWVTLAGDKYLAIGTSQKYYIESGGSLNDITPVRLTVRRPIEVSGVSGALAVGSAVGSTAIAPEITGFEAAGELGASGTLTTTNIPIEGTSSVGSVTIETVDGSNVDVPVGG